MSEHVAGCHLSSQATRQVDSSLVASTVTCFKLTFVLPVCICGQINKNNSKGTSQQQR
jgi:hypothetical protein